MESEQEENQKKDQKEQTEQIENQEENQKIIDYEWLISEYRKPVPGDLEYDEIIKLIKDADLQDSEIKLIVDGIFLVCEFPYKALAAIINLRREHKGLLTNVDISEIETMPPETEISIYIGSKKYEHADIDSPSTSMSDYFDYLGHNPDMAW
jgi:hypothetical protein